MTYPQIQSNLMISNNNIIAGLVFNIASTHTTNNVKAVHNAKEFLKTSETIQDFRRQNSYEKSQKAKSRDVVYSSKTVEWPSPKCDTVILW